jgi:hypothetical protein
VCRLAVVCVLCWFCVICTALYCFRKNHHFDFRHPYKGILFLELRCSYSSGPDVRWINSWTPNMNKIRPTVQALLRRTYYCYVIDCRLGLHW